MEEQNHSKKNKSQRNEINLGDLNPLASILDMILGFLPIRDLMNARLVSKSFLFMTRIPSTWINYFGRKGIDITPIRGFLNHLNACLHYVKLHITCDVIRDFANERISFNKNDKQILAWENDPVEYIKNNNQFTQERIVRIDPVTRQIFVETTMRDIYIHMKEQYKHILGIKSDQEKLNCLGIKDDTPLFLGIDRIQFSQSGKTYKMGRILCDLDGLIWSFIPSRNDTAKQEVLISQKLSLTWQKLSVEDIISELTQVEEGSLTPRKRIAIEKWKEHCTENILRLYNYYLNKVY